MGVNARCWCLDWIYDPWRGSEYLGGLNRRRPASKLAEQVPKPRGALLCPTGRRCTASFSATESSERFDLPPVERPAVRSCRSLGGNFFWKPRFSGLPGARPRRTCLGGALPHRLPGSDTGKSPPRSVSVHARSWPWACVSADDSGRRPRPGVRRLQPLARRLHVDWDDPRFDNLRDVQIRLFPFSLDRLVEVGRKVRALYPATQRARIEAKVNDDVIAGLAQGVAGKLGGKVGVAPRIFLKKLVLNVLDKVEDFEDFDPVRDSGS